MLWKIIFSAFLLILAYPNFNLEYLAWIALIPLFFALENKNIKQRFVAGYIFGVIFFSGILYWLTNVTVPGTIILILLLSLAPAIFCLLYATRRASSLYAIIFVPSAWVLTENLRAHLFTGFPWALLAHSQSLNLPVIQIADITGAYGVSFLIVLVNFGVYLALKKTPKRFYILFFIFILFSLTWTYGQNRINYVYPARGLKVSVIQGNIPQHIKWDPSYKKFIIDKYCALTKESLKENPDLVIWPETAVPGYLEEPYLKRQVLDLAKSGNTHLLVGTLREEGYEFFNSATLISDKGEVLQNYDKIHLVPFGEFVPFEKLLFPMRAFIDKPIGDFDRGSEFTVFKAVFSDVIPSPRNIQKTTRFHSFSALICFEDIFPGLSRHLVKKGARFLVNITNDAWFGKTAAPYQHAQGSIFRAVENRTPVVRAANTGLSCIIDHKGKILKSVRTGKGQIFVEGYVAGMIMPTFTKTFYTRFGDVFSWLCIVLVLFGLVRRSPKPVQILILALILTHASSVYGEDEIHYREKFKFGFPFGKKYNYDNILVTRVIDGDTIELQNRERVRLIGIDTPEVRFNPKLKRDAKRTKKEYEAIIAMGKIAAEFTKNLVEGKKVKLEFDIEKKDRYGRLLAYVYLADGRMLNAELVKEGYANVYTFPPNVKYVDMFLELQREARENNRGLWDENG
ncbi:MAG: apolipoprotein N-acyltransferase [Candidatus Omnitrophota bacterium]|nr:MAG: apolipoprotein N-acyltransferase [Candidatus Omnitrophota bacterium]